MASVGIIIKASLRDHWVIGKDKKGRKNIVLKYIWKIFKF